MLTRPAYRTARSANLFIPCALLGLFVLLGALLGGARSAGANGWEHWGIPVETLLRALDGPDPAYRVRAAQSLGIRAEPRATPRLIELLRNPEEPLSVRVAAARALGQMAAPQALAPLDAALRTAQDDALRAASAAAIGELGAAEGLASMLERLSLDASIVVRTQIVEALGQFDDSRAVRALSTIAADRSQASARLKAIAALGQSGAMSATPTLVKLLQSESSARLHAAVVDALGALGDPRAADALRALLDETSNPVLEVHITVALGSMRGADVVAGLTGLLDHPVDAVRYFAIEGLRNAGQRSDTQAIDGLLKAYAQATETATRTRADALGAGVARSVPSAYLAQQSLRIAALQALHALHAPAALDAFIAAAGEARFERGSSLALRLNEGVYQLRRVAIAGLGYTRSERAARFIVDSGALADQDFRLRATAVRALGVLGVFGNIDSGGAVASMLGDTAAEVRWVAAKTLGRLREATSATALLPAVGDPHAEVRRQAVLSLGYLNARDSLERVEQVASEDPNADVRAAANAAAALLKR